MVTHVDPAGQLALVVQVLAQLAPTIEAQTTLPSVLRPQPQDVSPDALHAAEPQRVTVVAGQTLLTGKQEPA